MQHTLGIFRIITVGETLNIFAHTVFSLKFKDSDL